MFRLLPHVSPEETNAVSVIMPAVLFPERPTSCGLPVVNVDEPRHCQQSEFLWSPAESHCRKAPSQRVSCQYESCGLPLRIFKRSAVGTRVVREAVVCPREVCILGEGDAKLPPGGVGEICFLISFGAGSDNLHGRGRPGPSLLVRQRMFLALPRLTGASHHARVLEKT